MGIAFYTPNNVFLCGLWFSVTKLLCNRYVAVATPLRSQPLRNGCLCGKGLILFYRNKSVMLLSTQHEFVHVWKADSHPTIVWSLFGSLIFIPHKFFVWFDPTPIVWRAVVTQHSLFVWSSSQTHCLVGWSSSHTHSLSDLHPIPSNGVSWNHGVRWHEKKLQLWDAIILWSITLKI